MAALRMAKRWLSGLLATALVSVTVGVGCGSAATPAPKQCCKSMCQHSGDSKDPQKCCETTKRSKPSLSIPFADATPVKKVFESVLLIDTHPQNHLFEGVLVEKTFVPPPKIFKLPQQELYKLTSALLI